MPRQGDPYHITLSKWPLRDGEGAWHAFHRGRGAILQSPFGLVGFAHLHPQSPRSLSTWREGNHVVTEAVQLARTEFAGLPTLLVGDLNAAPSGARSMRLADSGFMRAKPLWTPTGTFPSWLVWPAQVAIDDVWVSREWRVISWETVRIPGSDHLGVCVSLSLDTGRAEPDSSGQRSGGRTRP
jgi:hypothetical protein